MRARTEGIAFKLAVLVVLAALAVAVGGAVTVAGIRPHELAVREAEMRGLTGVATSVLDEFHGREVAGKLTRAEAQREALAVLRRLRYGGSEYFWVNDMTPRMVMHPIQPALDGRDLTDYRDADGEPVFVTFVTVVRQRGAGLVHYRWPKPGATKAVPKISYVRGFAPWGWIVGTGVYVDDIDHAARVAAVQAVARTAVILAVLVLVAVQLSRSVHRVVESRTRALAMVDEKTSELQHQALHDALTGLPNRALILDRLGQALARSRRQHTAVSVMFVDLDNFKDINDTFGHGVGDDLLRGVASRFSGALRECDTVGRIGGDEFVVLSEGSPDEPASELIAQRLLDVLREPFALGGSHPVPCVVSASIGIARAEGQDADGLLRDADVALYQAKQQGRNRFVLFQPSMHAAVQNRLQLEMDLRHALERRELFVVYQPTFDMRTMAVTGVEALLRWRHPSRGVVLPTSFVPLAEETGLIVDIGRWVLAEAARQMAVWHAEGLSLRLSVNVSARQLESDTLLRDVREALAASRLPAEALTLEITESTLMRDADATARRLTELKRLGVRIAIDDFGTGYSSLAYLQQFPVDMLKIDRSFVTEIATSTEAAVLIRTLIQLGKTLGIETVAEGIESADQFARLQDEACETGQGFLVARPLEPAALAEFVARSSSGPDTASARDTVGAADPVIG